MIVMNPYHAHESPVGYVFDVAKWSSRNTFLTGIFGIILGVLLTVATLHVWNPELLRIQRVIAKLPGNVQEPAREALDGLSGEIRKLHLQHPRALPAGICVAGLFAFVFVASGVAFLADSRQGGKWFFRAGPGGMSLRVPAGVDVGKLCLRSTVLELHLAWREIEKWEVIQKKQFGSLSPNAGNLDATLIIRTRAGQTHQISLDDFREPARIIYNRIQEATEMVPASMKSDTALQGY